MNETKMQEMSNLGEFRVLTLRETPPVQIGDCPERVADYYHKVIAVDPRHNPDQENLYVVLLNSRRKIIGYTRVGMGTVDTVLMHPREVFRPAIVGNATAIVVLHNHPSGEVSPSEADVVGTRRLIQAGELLQIELLDHLVMAQGRHSSLRGLGYWK